MGQRNMVYTGPLLDTGNEHARLCTVPCVMPYGGMMTSRQPNNHHATLPSVMTQYNGSGHCHIEPSNTFVLASPNVGVIPAPAGYVLHDQFMDGFNAALKGKNPAGFPVNFQHVYPRPGPSSSVAVPMNMDGIVLDVASFSVPAYRSGNNVVQPVLEAGPYGSTRNGAAGAIGVDPVLAHNNAHFVPINYGQPLQAMPAPWRESWNLAPGIPYSPGYISRGGMEAANMGLHGYPITANRDLVAFVHPPLLAPHQGPQPLNRPPPPPPPIISSLQGQNMDFHPQLASTSQMLPVNGTTSYAAINPFQIGVERMPMFVGPTTQTSLGLYVPHHQEMMVESTARRHMLPHLRVLPQDGVAILDVSDYGTDHHREMRLDVDNMSYEELLALSEQIGSVGSRLSLDFVVDHLKTRTFASSHPEDDGSSADQENFCVVCQMEYKNEEKIGALDCGHEYHVDCIKKWLVVKNTCPVCKSVALATGENQSKESHRQG